MIPPSWPGLGQCWMVGVMVRTVCMHHGVGGVGTEEGASMRAENRGHVSAWTKLSSAGKPVTGLLGACSKWTPWLRHMLRLDPCFLNWQSEWQIVHPWLLELWWVCVHSGLAAHIQVLVPPPPGGLASKGLWGLMDLSHRRHVERGHAQELFALLSGRRKQWWSRAFACRIRPSKFESQILMLKKESNLLGPSVFTSVKWRLKTPMLRVVTRKKEGEVSKEL